MYPSWISRSLCSAGIVRCIKPLAQSRNETNSSWVNGADKSGFIFQTCASGAAVQASHPATTCHNQTDPPGFPSGRLISSNEGTWVLFHHDSSAAPQTVQIASPVCGTKNFVSVRLYSAPQLHRTIVAILGICARNRPFSSVKLCHNQTHRGIPLGDKVRAPSRRQTGHLTSTVIPSELSSDAMNASASLGGRTNGPPCPPAPTPVSRRKLARRPRRILPLGS